MGMTRPIDIVEERSIDYRRPNLTEDTACPPTRTLVVLVVTLFYSEFPGGYYGQRRGQPHIADGQAMTNDTTVGVKVDPL